MITGNDLADGLLAFALIVIAVVWFVIAYNNLDAAAQRTAQAWGNVDALLKQRHDELSRFIDACRPHVQQPPLLDVIEGAREAAFAARQARDTAALGLAESKLGAGLGQLMALVDARPELAAGDTIAAMRKRLAELEAGLNERRAIFNDAVRQNNAALAHFPGNIVALLGGFRAVPPFDAERGQT